MAAPRTRAIRSRVSSVITPAQCSAVSSPRLCPIPTVASKPNSSNTFNPASEAVTTAGCITRVDTVSPSAGNAARTYN